MSYTSFTTWENRDEWPEPPKGYYYMPPEEDIIKLREVNGEILNDPHKPPADFYLFSRIVQDPHCLLYTSPSPRDKRQARMPSSA